MIKVCENFRQKLRLNKKFPTHSVNCEFEAHKCEKNYWKVHDNSSVYLYRIYVSLPCFYITK